LDWNGPTSRIFSKFRDEDLDRPIIDHFERVARRHRNRIAVTDSDTSLSFAELWDGLSGLAETIAAETKHGDLIGIVLPTCSMFPSPSWLAWRRDAPLSPWILTIQATG